MNKIWLRLRSGLVLFGLLCTGVYFPVIILSRFIMGFSSQIGVIYGAVIPIAVALVFVVAYMKWGHGIFSMQKRQYPEKYIILIVALLTIIPRVVLMVQFPVELSSDFATYYQYASSYAETGGVPIEDYIIAICPNVVLFVTFLGKLFRIFSSNVYVGLMANHILFTITAVLFYLALRLLVSQRLALLGTLLFSLNLPFLIFSRSLSIEPFGLFFLILGWYLFLLWDQKTFVFIESGSIKNKASSCIHLTKWRIILAICCGAILAIANNIRPNGVILLIALTIAVLFYPSKRRLMLLGCMLITFIGVSSLLHSHQEAVLQTTISGVNFGWTLFEGLNPVSYGNWTQENAELLTEIMSNYQPEEVQSVFLQMALQNAQTFDAPNWIRLILGKGVRIWSICDYMISSDMLSHTYLNFTIDAIHQFELATYSILTFVTIRKGKDLVDHHIFTHYLFLVGMIILHSFATSISRYQYIAMPFLYAAAILMLQGILNRQALDKVLLK